MLFAEFVDSLARLQEGIGGDMEIFFDFNGLKIEPRSFNFNNVKLELEFKTVAPEGFDHGLTDGQFDAIDSVRRASILRRESLRKEHGPDQASE